MSNEGTPHAVSPTRRSDHDAEAARASQRALTDNASAGIVDLIKELSARVARLESESSLPQGRDAEPHCPVEGDALQTDAEHGVARLSRRKVLLGAAGAAAAGLVGAVGSATPAAASTTGKSVTLGSSNTATAPTGLSANINGATLASVNSGKGNALSATVANPASPAQALSAITNGSGHGVMGTATGSGVGVAGTATSGSGVSGTSTSGPGVSGTSQSGPAGLFTGDVIVTGELYTTGASATVPLAQYNVRAFGAVGDGTTDDYAAVQRTVDAAIAAGGGEVLFPAGKYLLSGQLTIASPTDALSSSVVSLRGVGWTTYPGSAVGQPPDAQSGSWIYKDTACFGNTTAVSFQQNNKAFGVRGAGIRDLAFYYKGQSTSGPPLNINAAIDVYADDVHIENVFLYNPTIGVWCTNVGRLKIDGLYGNPMKIGLHIDSSYDVDHISRIHFWPYWADSNLTTLQYGTALDLFRCDNPIFSDIFALGYNHGMYIGQSPSGTTSKLKLSNADFDFCNIGLQVDSIGSSGQISNITTQGVTSGSPTSYSSEAGIKFTGSGARYSLTNVDIRNVRNNGIRVENGDNYLLIQNLHMFQWNQSGAGFPGLEVVAGGTSGAYLSPAQYFNNTIGNSPKTGGNVLPG